MSDEDLATAMMLGEPSISKLDASAMKAALNGFPLEPIKPIAWISRGVQGAVYYVRKFGDDESRLSNSDVRDELLGLAEEVFSTIKRLKNLSSEAESAAWHTAFGQALDQAGAPTHNFLVERLPAYSAIEGAQSRLLEVGSLFLSSAERMAKLPQKAKWRQREEHEKKVALAYYLSPVFEIGFGKTPAPNTWEQSDGSVRMGYWPDFYQRVRAAAFGERATPNLLRILKEARRLNRASGGIFPADLLPD